MATSVLMGSDQENQRIKGGSEETRPENVKQSGRRRSKTKNNDANQRIKKQPQRGMGVAQLERLRLQERWKKMTTTTTEINSLHSPYFIQSSFPDPTVTNTHHGVINGRDQSGPNQTWLLQRFGNGRGFNGLPVGSAFGGVLTNQFLVDPYGVGAPNQGFRVGNLTETSKELSSIPNIPCYSGHCNVCYKKKRIGENLACNGVLRDSFTEIPQINGCNLLGFNTQNINGGLNANQGIEVVAVHKNGNSGGSSGGNNVLMEYEFFPGKGGRRSTFIEKLKFGSEASCVTTTTTTSTSGLDTSNSVDLSLKLSY